MEPLSHTAPALPKTQYGKLLSILGVGFGIAVTIGATIGIGILGILGHVGLFIPGLLQILVNR